MRSVNLKIVISDGQTDVTSMLINFHDIATGPYHFDYELNIARPKGDKRTTTGKISFDLKMPQIVIIQLRTDAITCRM